MPNTVAGNDNNLECVVSNIVRKIERLHFGTSSQFIQLKNVVNSLRNWSKMPGKLLKRAHYDLVDESSDSKIPVHTDEAFEHGIRFKAKVSL